MKHYKDFQNKLYGFEEGQIVPDGLIEISKIEADQIGVLNFEKERELALSNLDYVRQRIMYYPEIGEFIDAWVKQDEQALEEYRQKCLDVKNRFPKPEGF